ncbi:MAG: aspartate--tRNA ligase [Patescibacteria group bacterium]
MKLNLNEAPGRVGQEVELYGWIDVRRDHGKLIFFDLRDRSGKMQLVVTPKDAVLHELAEKLRPEWVVKISGTVAERPAEMKNPKEPAGNVEVKVSAIEIISEAKTPPIPLDSDGRGIEEEMRLKYRYLDLRRARMQKNILLRHKATTLAREFLNNKGFVEIETPLLTKTSPEGARDFLVPSRKYPGKFFALPQSPQQYKQLLMIAGFERYYQIARCLRDEDLRGDRQYEHTQIDMEMSFVTEEEVRRVAEEMMIDVVEGCGKKVLANPFPVYTHEEAMAKFGADKFDLRPEPKDPDTLAFAWVVDFPLLEWDENEKSFTFAHNPFSAPKAEHVASLLRGENLGNIRAQQYDLVCNGCELASGGVRISNPVVQRKVFEIIGLTAEETEERFGHIIEAYAYGAPPHAGIAPGLDRLTMILAGETSIAEVIAFPKTGAARDPMMNTPSEVPASDLEELGIEIKKRNINLGVGHPS